MERTKKNTDIETETNSEKPTGGDENNEDIKQQAGTETEIKVDPPDPDAPIWWKRVGGKKSHHHFGKIIKPNERFKERPSRISKELRDVIIPLEPLPSAAAVIHSETVKVVTYALQQRGIGWFDVVSSTGKIMNESKSLRKAEAEKYIQELTQ